MRLRFRASRSAVVVLVAAAIGLAGCAGAEPEPLEPEVVTETPEQSVDKTHAPDPQIEEAWPLTGVAGEVAARDVMSVKVENSVAARPQTGLQSADIVWEEMIEGGETRLLAVYHSTVPETIGPIRSLRPMDIPLATPFGGQLIFSGAQRAFLDAAHASPLQILTNDAGAAGFYRSADRRAPHNVYGNTADFIAQGSGDEDVEAAFSYAPEPEFATAVAEGESTGSLQLSFPNTSPSWTWAPDDDAWLRSEAGADAMTTDEGRLSAVNVLVLRVEVHNTSYTDPSGSPVPETVVTGSGEAIIATGGHTVTGTWSKDADDAHVQLRIEDGDEVLLAAGNTWVELLPVSGSSVSLN